MASETWTFCAHMMKLSHIMVICIQLFSLFGPPIRETSLSSYLLNIKGELDQNFLCADVKASNCIINNPHFYLINNVREHVAKYYKWGLMDHKVDAR